MDNGESGARLLVDRLDEVVRLLFLAGLAMHSVQERLESDFGRGRAALAVAALDEALDDLQSLEDTLRREPIG